MSKKIDTNEVVKRSMQINANRVENMGGAPVSITELAKRADMSVTSLCYALRGKRRWSADNWLSVLAQMQVLKIKGDVITIDLRDKMASIQQSDLDD